MVTSVSSDDVRVREVVTPDGRFVRSFDYFGSGVEIREGPQAFLVEQQPNITLRPHFHRVDQFQVVVAGGGKLGKEDLHPIDIHYSDAFTPYGPILAGAQGISFFTLRLVSDLGAQYMPESRAKLERKAGRSFAIKVDVHKKGELSKDQAARLDTLLELHEDGLAVFLLSLGPLALAAGAELNRATGCGQYYLVAKGSVRLGDREYAANSCAFLPPREAPPGWVGGPHGGEVLVLQFPREAG